MKKYQLISILSMLFYCISCNSDNNVTKTECSVTGTLRYESVSNRWEIHETAANTIDEVNIYIVEKYKIDLPKDSVANVHVTGFRYPSSSKIVLPAGTTLYSIEVKSLIINPK